MIRLAPLPYALDALEPVISAKALEVHYRRHHATYVEKANALAAQRSRSAFPLEQLIRDAEESGDRQLFNNAAQAWNHAFFWNSMTPGRSAPSNALAAAIQDSFGDPGALRAQFLEQGAGHFGSGWIWLIAQSGRLRLLSTHDAGTAASGAATPLLVCDLWEHAYYLDHRNDRAGFLTLWWDRLANWDFASGQLAAHANGRAAWTYPREVESYVPPLGDHDTFARALEEAGMLLDAEPGRGSEEDRRLGGLLQRIAEFEPQAPAIGQTPNVSLDLERRIRSAARRASEARGDGEHHWSPMVGGDLRRETSDGAGRDQGR